MIVCICPCIIIGNTICDFACTNDVSATAAPVATLCGEGRRATHNTTAERGETEYSDASCITCNGYIWLDTVKELIFVATGDSDFKRLSDADFTHPPVQPGMQQPVEYDASRDPSQLSRPPQHVIELHLLFWISFFSFLLRLHIFNCVYNSFNPNPRSCWSGQAF